MNQNNDLEEIAQRLHLPKLYLKKLNTENKPYNENMDTVNEFVVSDQYFIEQETEKRPNIYFEKPIYQNSKLTQRVNANFDQDQNWKNNKLIFTIDYRENYPVYPPLVQIEPNIFHVNVGKDGYFSFESMYLLWQPYINLYEFIEHIMNVLKSPKPDVAYNQKAKKLYVEDKEEFFKQMIQSYEQKNFKQSDEEYGLPEFIDEEKLRRGDDDSKFDAGDFEKLLQGQDIEQIQKSLNLNPNQFKNQLQGFEDSKFDFGDLMMNQIQKPERKQVQLQQPKKPLIEEKIKKPPQIEPVIMFEDEGSLKKKVNEDYQKFQKDQEEQNEENFSVLPSEDNCLIWEGLVLGPQNTCFENGAYEISLEFDKYYPSVPPKIQIKSKIFHQNIDENGLFDNQIFYDDWGQQQNLIKFITQIRRLMMQPSPKFIKNEKAYELASKNEQEYKTINEQIVSEQ